MDDRSAAKARNLGRHWRVLLLSCTVIGLGLVLRMLFVASPVDQAQPSSTNQPTAVALAASPTIKPSPTATIVLFPSTTPRATPSAQARTALVLLRQHQLEATPRSRVRYVYPR